MKLLLFSTLAAVTFVTLRADVPADAREVWFEARGTNTTKTANGSLTNPLGGAEGVFDANMHALCAGKPGAPAWPSLVIHLGAGVYMTAGWKYNTKFDSSDTAWRLRAGQRLVGAGIDNTIIRRANPTNDLYYVVGSAFGEAGVEIADLTVDANYWASANPRISGGGVNFGNLGRARGIKVVGTSGNTSINNGDMEFYSLRMSGTTVSGAVDRTATGGVIEGCEVSHIKGGYISGLMPGAGQLLIHNNRLYLPHWTSNSTDNAYNKKSRCINFADSVNTIITGNFTSGGYSGIYSDTGTETNIIIGQNEFLDTVRGIEFLRGYAAQADSLLIVDNVIHLTTDSSVSDGRYGILLHTQMADGSSQISRCTIRGNIVKGGHNPGNTWGIFLKKVNYPICYDNQIDFIEPSGANMQTYFETSGGMIYNLVNQQGVAVDREKWRSRQSSEGLAQKLFLSSDPTTTYTLKSGDKYVGVQKSNLTLVLPDASSFGGKEYILVNETGGVLKGTGVKCATAGQTINGSPYLSLSQPYSSARLISNGLNWIRF